MSLFNTNRFWSSPSREQSPQPIVYASLLESNFENGSYLMELPTEIIVRIFRYLRINHAFALSRTCSRLHEIMMHSQVWMTFFHERFLISYWPSYFNSLPQTCLHPTSHLFTWKPSVNLSRLQKGLPNSINWRHEFATYHNFGSLCCTYEETPLAQFGYETCLLASKAKDQFVVLAFDPAHIVLLDLASHSVADTLTVSDDAAHKVSHVDFFGERTDRFPTIIVCTTEPRLMVISVGPRDGQAAKMEVVASVQLNPGYKAKVIATEMLYPFLAVILEETGPDVPTNRALTTLNIFFASKDSESTQWHLSRIASHDFRRMEPACALSIWEPRPRLTYIGVALVQIHPGQYPNNNKWRIGVHVFPFKLGASSSAMPQPIPQERPVTFSDDFSYSRWSYVEARKGEEWHRFSARSNPERPSFLIYRFPYLVAVSGSSRLAFLSMDLSYDYGDDACPWYEVSGCIEFKLVSMALGGIDLASNGMLVATSVWSDCIRSWDFKKFDHHLTHLARKCPRLSDEPEPNPQDADYFERLKIQRDEAAWNKYFKRSTYASIWEGGFEQCTVIRPYQQAMAGEAAKVVNMKGFDEVKEDVVTKEERWMVGVGKSHVVTVKHLQDGRQVLGVFDFGRSELRRLWERLDGEPSKQ